MQALPFESKVIAHRGAAFEAPENTIAAFNRAWELGCRVIEFDIMLSQDGIPVVIHDDTLNRTTNGKGKVIDKTWEELKKLDAGHWFNKKFANERIPNLIEVIEWLVFTDSNANFEIKAHPNHIEATVTAVLSALNQHWPRNKPLPLISSFDHSTLTLIRDLAPEIQLGIILHHWKNDWQREAIELTATSIHLSKKIATKARIEAIKAAGFCVLVYTINKPNLIKKLLNFGADAVFTDNPKICLEL